MCVDIVATHHLVTSNFYAFAGEDNNATINFFLENWTEDAILHTSGFPVVQGISSIIFAVHAARAAFTFLVSSASIPIITISEDRHSARLISTS